jgi:thiol-disulfide isomerase/thioredoxin
MKTKLLILSLITSTALFGQGFKISGKVKGLKDTVMYFGHYYADKNKVLDTARVNEKGAFVFEGKKKLEGGLYLVVLPDKRYFELIIDNEQNFSLETDSSDLVGKMKIHGSQDNIDFYKYMAFIKEMQSKADPVKKQMDKTKNKDSIDIFKKQLADLTVQVESEKKKFMAAHPTAFFTRILKASEDIVVPPAPMLPNGRKDSTFQYRFYKQHYWDNIDLSDGRMLNTPIFYNKFKFYIDKMIMQVPDSLNHDLDALVEKVKGSKELYKYVVSYVTYYYESSKLMGMDAVFVHMVNKHYRTKQAYWVDSTQLKTILNRADIVEPLLIGKKSRNLIMPDTTGKNMKALHDVKAKYTVLYFWEPGCGHCQVETPKLNEFYNKYKSKGVEVYAVNIEDNVKEWKDFIIKHKLSWINVDNLYHHYYLREIFDIYSTPVIYLLDQNKVILAKRIPLESLEGYIDFLEKNNKK